MLERQAECSAGYWLKDKDESKLSAHPFYYRIDISRYTSQDKKQTCVEHTVALDVHRKAGSKQQYAQYDESHAHGREGTE